MEIEIDGPGAFAVDVVGVSQYQDVLEAAAEAGATVRATLVLKDANPYDDQAVAVHIDGRRAGYLSRANARLYRADLAAAGDPRLTVRCNARIVGGFETVRGERAHFGINLIYRSFQADAIRRKTAQPVADRLSSRANSSP